MQIHDAVRTVKLTTILLMASASRGILRSQFAEAADNSSAELQSCRIESSTDNGKLRGELLNRELFLS